MKITNDVLERLSAYADDELSPEEKFETEELLRTSAALREELSRIRKMKEAVGAFKHLPEDAFFETRLMQNLKSKNRFFSKYPVSKPAVVFAAATLIMMVVLKSNTGFFVDWFSQGRSGLEEFYSKNLTSLLMAADLTNEDLFDFAFNKSLPLDEGGNKVLAIGTDVNGKEFLEVKYTDPSEDGLKLRDFVKKFNLNDEQKGKVDSILESYSDRLASVVLVNDKNTIAVNPDLWKYHNMMRKDLLEYASTVNKAALINVVGSEIAFNDIIHEPEPEAPKVFKTGESYYFITPDSVFFSTVKVDEAKLKQDIASAKSSAKSSGTAEKRIKIDLSPVFSVSSEPDSRSSMKVLVKDNSLKVMIPEGISPMGLEPELDNLAIRLDSVFNQLQKQSLNFRMEYPAAPGTDYSMTVRTEVRRGNNYSFGYEAPDAIDIRKDSAKSSKRSESSSGIQKKPKKSQSNTVPELPDMQFYADSLVKKFGQDFPRYLDQGMWEDFLNRSFPDTNGVNKDQLREQIRKEMLQFRREMNRLREEMKKFREELKPEERKKSSDPIEI